MNMAKVYFFPMELYFFTPCKLIFPLHLLWAKILKSCILNLRFNYLLSWKVFYANLRKKKVRLLKRIIHFSKYTWQYKPLIYLSLGAYSSHSSSSGSGQKNYMSSRHEKKQTNLQKHSGTRHLLFVAIKRWHKTCFCLKNKTI